MVRGPLARLVHDHFFTDDGHGATLMRDVFDFDAPGSALGRAAERIFLTGYFRRFLESRNEALKVVAESAAWRQFLPMGAAHGEALG